WSPNEEVVLQAFEDYHEGRPFLDQVVFKIFPGNPLEKIFEEFSSKRELEESIVPSDKSDEINRDPRYKPYIRLKKPTLSILYLGLNNKLSPFTDKRVRQAFNYAVNREAIVRDITKRGSIVARGILPPGMSAYNPELQGYYYDPAKAKRLLAEAGYPDGKGLPKIELWSGSKAESTLKELDAYKGYFEDIGVNVEVTFAPDSKTFFERLSKGEVPMFRASWFADIPDPDNFLYVLFHSQSKTNRTFYRNKKVDELLTQARKETDYLKRISLYREVEKIVIDDAPWIGQHHHVFEYLFQPYVHGVEINSLGGPYIPMKKIWLDKNARKGS
ncbi:MAG: hypothetical protein HY731_07070, partial [Candidatus Tectomicrobia bacterium]|nr:hypothetical protein [Candidatus Tectomicrobia bacterium]